MHDIETHEKQWPQSATYAFWTTVITQQRQQEYSIDIKGFQPIIQNTHATILSTEKDRR